MNRDPLESSVEGAKGKAKEASDLALHDDDLHSDGKIDQVSGKTPADYGDAREREKDNLDKL